ncbi:hypothetical protein U1Q18_029750 [Sarracenia purpurea var. burkii]
MLRNQVVAVLWGGFLSNIPRSSVNLGAREESGGPGVPSTKIPHVSHSKDMELPSEKKDVDVGLQEGAPTEIPSRLRVTIRSSTLVVPNFDRDKGKGIAEPSKGARPSTEGYASIFVEGTSGLEAIEHP